MRVFSTSLYFAISTQLDTKLCTLLITIIVPTGPHNVCVIILIWGFCTWRRVCDAIMYRYGTVALQAKYDVVFAGHDFDAVTTNQMFVATPYLFRCSVTNLEKRFVTTSIANQKHHHSCDQTDVVDDDRVPVSPRPAQQ